MSVWPLPRLIGLCGPRRAGKDTIAEVLSATEAYHPIALATPLKTLAETLWPQGFPRDAVQALGATVRAQDAAALIQVVVRTIHAAPPSQRWVITDLRMPHELAQFQATFRDEFAAIAITARPDILAQRIAQSTRPDALQETRSSGTDITEQWAQQIPDAVQAVWDTSDVAPADPFSAWALRLHSGAWWASHPLKPKRPNDSAPPTTQTIPSR